MKKVMIPTCESPFNVFVNGEKYTYPSGTEQEVPDEVAIVIEQYNAYHEEKAKVESGEANQGGGGTGGGAVGNCKLKLTVESRVEYGQLILLDGNNTTIDLTQNYGTTELDIPCGSALVLACEYFRSADKLTQVYACDHAAVYQAPSEPGAVASLKVYF